MGKRMSVLLALTMTVIGLTAGVAPAHAGSEPEPYSAIAYSSVNFQGKFSLLPAAVTPCTTLPFKHSSAENKSSIYVIRLYTDLKCSNVVAVLHPGDTDSGYRDPDGTAKTDLGYWGGYFYSVSFF